MAEEHSNSSRSSSYSSGSRLSQRSRSRSDSKKMRMRGKKISKPKRGQQKHAIQFPPLEQSLLDFEQFQELYTSSDLTIEKLRSLYGVYERQWEIKQRELFFEQHREEQWIQDKYNPDFRKIYGDERNAYAQNMFQEFVKQYNLGGYSTINFTLTEQQLYEQFELNDNFYNDDQEVPFWEFQLKESIDISKSPYFLTDPNLNSAFIKNVPLGLSRQEITNVLSKLPGYLNLCLSEPSKLQPPNRMGWVSFDCEENCNKCLNLEDGIKIKEYTLYFQKQQEKKKFVRIFKSVDQNKLWKDLDIQRDLIKCLDKEKNIKGNPLTEGPTKDKDDPIFQRQLDLQTLYLRKVHNFCYWSCAEFSNYRLLVAKVGYHFLRLDSKRNCNLKWQKIVQSLIKRRIDNSQNEQTVADLVDLELVEIGIRNKQTKQSDVYPCNFCEKQFQGCSYLIKHITGKHPETYKEQQKELSQSVRDLQMANLYRQERISKSTIQRQIFQNGSIDEQDFIDKKLILPINFAPRVIQRLYKDLDSIAQEKTQPSIMIQVRESKVNYNNI